MYVQFLDKGETHMVSKLYIGNELFSTIRTSSKSAKFEGGGPQILKLDIATDMASELCASVHRLWPFVLLYKQEMIYCLVILFNSEDNLSINWDWLLLKFTENNKLSLSGQIFTLQIVCFYIKF